MAPVGLRLLLGQRNWVRWTELRGGAVGFHLEFIVVGLGFVHHLGGGPSGGGAFCFVSGEGFP